MKLVLLLLLPAVLAHPRATNQCRLLDANPFFKSLSRSSPEAVERDIELLTEFARFSQSTVPSMLARFAKLKRDEMVNPEGLAPTLDNSQLVPSQLVPFWAYWAPFTGEFWGNVGQPFLPTIVRPGDEEVEGEPGMPSLLIPGNTFLEHLPAMPGMPGMQGMLGMPPMPDMPGMPGMPGKPGAAGGMPGEPGKPGARESPRSMANDEAQQSIKDAIAGIVDAVKDVLRKFKDEPLNIGTLQAIAMGVFEGVKDALKEFGIKLPENIELPDSGDLSEIHLPSLPLPSSFSLSDWPLVCKLIWWPMDEEHCASMRCAMCSTSMLAASRACELKEGAVSHLCIRERLGEGACNYCTLDYLTK